MRIYGRIILINVTANRYHGTPSHPPDLSKEYSVTAGVDSTMPSRRQVLATLGASAAGILAGCGCEAFPGRNIELAVDDLASAGGGWELGVTATATFINPDEDTSLDGVDIAAYSRDRRVLDHETVGGMRWADVPDENREDGDCATSGSLVVPATLSVDEVPYWIGPRFTDGETARAFAPEGSDGFSRLIARRYGDRPTPTRPTARPTTTRNGTRPSNSTPQTGTTTAAGTDRPPGTDSRPVTDRTPTQVAWPPSDPSADDYREVSVEGLPWPRPHEQALYETPALSTVRFESGPACSPERRPPRIRQFGSSDGTDVGVLWSRSIPEDTCQRPYLTDVAYGDGILTLTVGLHEVSYAVCHGCERIPYQLGVTARQGDPDTFEEAVIEHRTDGELVERVVVSPE